MSQLTRQAWIGLVRLVAMLVLCLFLPAWSYRYWQAWAYLVLFVASVVSVTLHLIEHDPELLKRRLAVGPKAEKERSQKLIQAVASVLFIAIYLVSGTDHRLGWSDVPPSVVILGDVLLLVGFRIVFLAFRANSYTAAVIQTVENQPVISTGPYATVRHPMYTGSLLLLLGTPLALGSYWALLCFVMMAVAIVWRLLDEERFLSCNLPGYVEYRSKVRYRLVPRVW